MPTPTSSPSLPIRSPAASPDSSSSSSSSSQFNSHSPFININNNTNNNSPILPLSSSPSQSSSSPSTRWTSSIPTLSSLSTSIPIKDEEEGDTHDNDIDNHYNNNHNGSSLRVNSSDDSPGNDADSDHHDDDDDQQEYLLQQQRDMHKIKQYELIKHMSPKIGANSPLRKPKSGNNSSPDSPSSSPSAAKSSSLFIFLYSALLLLSSVGNNIFFKKMINHMENHVYFLNQLTSSVFVPVFFCLVLYEFRYTKFITKEMTDFPKRKFFIMGIFDAVCGVLTMFGAVHTAGSTQALLSNSVIPITMVLSYFILKQRFRKLQYVGATVIMMGIGFVLYPQLRKSMSTDGGPPAEGVTDGDIPLFNFLFLLSVIPGALSSIYKELAFHNADIDANYLQFWVAIWQFLFGFLLIPLNSLPLLGNQYIPLTQLFSALSDGGKCLLGINVIVPPYCGNSPFDSIRCDQCEGAWIPLVIYLVFNLCFNMFSVLLIKYGSATLMFIIMTLRLPLIQTAFAMKFINDPPDPIQWTSGMGLLVILLGLVCYKFPHQKDKEEGKSDEGDDVRQGKVIIPGFLDNRSYHIAHIKAERVRPAIVQRSAQQIRSALYSQLGLIDSPPTPHSPAARKFQFNNQNNNPQNNNNFHHSSRVGIGGSPMKGNSNGVGESSPLIGIHSNVNNSSSPLSIQKAQSPSSSLSSYKTFSSSPSSSSPSSSSPLSSSPSSSRQNSYVSASSSPHPILPPSVASSRAYQSGGGSGTGNGNGSGGALGLGMGKGKRDSIE